MAVDSGHGGHRVSQGSLWPNCSVFSLVLLLSMTSLGVHNRIVIATCLQDISDIKVFVNCTSVQNIT